MEKAVVKKLFPFLAIVTAYANASAAIQVPVSFIEALSPKDTTSSERFKNEYQNAVQLGLDYNKVKLKQCGYEVIPDFIFFDASDEVQSFEKAKLAEGSGKWMIVGPRRSQQYLVLAKGAPTTPSVSTMASSSEVFELGALHLTMAPSNQAMAKVAALAAKERVKKKNLTYFSVVNSDCVTCRDFSEHFDLAVKSISLKKSGELAVTGDDPDLGDLLLRLKTIKPDIILLPNYSKPSAQIMFKLKGLTPAPVFVGGDGWGDSKFGFVEIGLTPDQAQGITVRGFPPVENGLKTFSVGNSILKDKAKIQNFPGSGSAQALIKITSDLTELLCQKRPKDRDAFAKAFKNKPYFSPSWGVSLYRLEKGEIIFEQIRKGRR